MYNLEYYQMVGEMKLRVKVGPKGQIVIPKPIRERMGIRPSDVVTVDVEGDRVIVETLQEDPIDTFARTAEKVGGKSSELVWGDRLYQELFGD